MVRLDLSSGGRFLRALLRWLGRTTASFARSNHGGAMLVAGVFVIGAMGSAGALMSNYAWHEAQYEEVHAAARAAVSVAGPMLAGAGGALDEEIKERIASFATAAVPGLTVAPETVSISYDADTNTTTIVVRGNHLFSDIWLWGDDEGSDEDTEVETVVKVRFESDRYEVAMALDVSRSMRNFLPDGVTRLDALKTAVRHVADTLEEESATTPGSVLVSIVPYSSAVNVADTCNPDPDTGHCTAARSAGKERFVRMLAGVRDTMGATLADARHARDGNTGGHWVDTFHHYGGGTDLGPLRRQYLPADLLDDRDWNLRRTGVAIDVRSQVPGLGVWRVDDADFWNGCVMARWGAYWNLAARPPGWTQDDPANWPARKSAPSWSPGASGLPASTPLHVSDAPPVASAPETLFTAFSWPDARIRGNADAWLQDGMIELLNPGVVRASRAVGDNDWSTPGNGGDVFCPLAPITPLTDDLDRLRTAVDDLTLTPDFVAGASILGATYMNLGVVWGLRTVSPLWQGVWDVQDVRRVPRPAVPCAPGEAAVGCDGSLSKSILLVSDGKSHLGGVAGSQLLNRSTYQPNPHFETEQRCYSDPIPAYHAAAADANAAAFNDRFRAPRTATDFVDASDRLNAAGREEFVDAFLAAAGAGRATPTRRDSMLNALATAAIGLPPTPWQLFRGHDGKVIDAIVDTASGFGFDGRPTLVDHRCRPLSTFSPYGRADDRVYIGDVGPDAMTPPRPIADVAPLEVASLPSSVLGDGSWDRFTALQFARVLSGRIDGWLLEACRVAGQRRVRINVVFIGEETKTTTIALLEQCVDLAGGDPDEDEVFVTPTSADLISAFEDIFTIRRNLRFLN